MPKKSFLERMGLIEGGEKEQNTDSGVLKDIQKEVNSINTDALKADLDQPDTFGFMSSESSTKSKNSPSDATNENNSSLSLKSADGLLSNEKDLDFHSQSVGDNLSSDASNELKDSLRSLSINSELSSASDSSQSDSLLDSTLMGESPKKDSSSESVTTISEASSALEAEFEAAKEALKLAAEKGAGIENKNGEKPAEQLFQNETILNSQNETTAEPVVNKGLNNSVAEEKPIVVEEPVLSEQVVVSESDENIDKKVVSEQSLDSEISNTIMEEPSIEPQHVVEEANVEELEEGILNSSFSTMAEELPSGSLRVEENIPSTTINIDPHISEKLDLIIGEYEKNKMLTIDDIYRNSRMETDTKKTIFMTDVFLGAIPENLPQEVKRETVLNILKISGIEMETILSDAYKRIDSLNKVLEDTVNTSNDIYQRNANTIRELERRIESLKQIDLARQEFQKDQTTTIEYEIQKIINLVEFVKPKN